MKRRSKQTSFTDPSLKSKLCFGGDLLKKASHRHARPISSKDTMHVVLKSSKAKGRFSFRNGQNALKVHSAVESSANLHGVRIIKYSNNFNHLHLHLKFSSRQAYFQFIRSVCARIAMAVSGACKTKPMKSIFGSTGFWDRRPFTRIVKGRKGFNTANDYVRLNQLEAEFKIPKRDGRLRDLTAQERLLFEDAASYRETSKRKKTESAFQQISFI